MDIFNSWLCKTLIAHRGLHDENTPENSMAAFKKAIEKGYAIELDIRPLKDGTIVVFHDETLNRMTSKKGLINERTYEEIKGITLKNSKEHIPTFSEFLDFVNGRVPVLIEIKNIGKVGFEKNVYELLKQYKGEYAVQSFNPMSLNWFRKNAPEVLRGQLSSFFEKDKFNIVKKFILKKMLLNKCFSQPHFISYNVDNLPNKYIRRYNNIPLLAWSVRSQEEYDKKKDIFDNIIFEGFIPKADK
jgi:glycerophosphoryl diester phosphodiesterase